jgi:hypothetical protein
MAFGSEQWMYASGFYPHEIGNSSRVNNGTYYTRTPSSGGNEKTWTWSAWVKNSGVTIGGYLLSAGASGNREFLIYFDGTNQRINVYQYSSGAVRASVITSAQFRDPSAWYHFVVAVDTTQTTASDRLKIYVNGEQQTDFASAQYPAQNLDTLVSSTDIHDIGKNAYNQNVFSNFYITEVNYINGSALTASSFGETKADTWIPKKYAGSYGSHDYYLNFATRATNPIDASGQGNNWTSVNVAAVSWMLDSPTNNFCTLNPLAQFGSPPISEGNLKVELANGSDGVFASIQPTGKKYYWEALLLSGIEGYGVMANSGNASSATNTLYYTDGRIYVANSLVTSSATTATSGDIIGIEYDPTAETIKFFKNNTQIGSTYAATGDGLLPFAGGTGNGSGVSVFNFGQASDFAGNKTAQGNTDANGLGDFYYAPPAGFLALCTANLPDPATAFNPAVNNSPQDHFNTVLYTGNGSTNNITGVGFQPDFVWIKSRSETYWHRAFDVLRGATKQLYQNESSAEATESTSLTAFGSDGFTLGSFQYTNNNNSTFVSWNWKASNSAGYNNDGTIQSIVSANTDAGFSVVAYTVPSGGGFSVGHGLNSTPKIILSKNRDTTSNWDVYSEVIGNTKRLMLNLTNAPDTQPAWNNTTPTSSVFYSVGGGSWHGVGSRIINYVFSEVEGFSKFGTYTGNGSADGPFIYTGFRPAFVMFKRTDSAVNWVMYDTSRDPYNYVDNTLYPDEAWAENPAGSALLDIVSNGFKLRSAGGTALNTSSGTYLYMAFAEMPFKYANAR